MVRSTNSAACFGGVNMDNVVSIERKTDARMLIDGCKEDMENEEQYSLEHYHTMWILKEIMLNPNNSEEDRLAAAYVAYTRSSVRLSIKYILDGRKSYCPIANKAIEIQTQCHELMMELCEATG
jgi:hypothetical protein